MNKRMASETLAEYKARRKADNNKVNAIVKGQSLFLINKKWVLNLRSIMLRALQSFYEQETFTKEQEKQLTDSISAWINNPDNGPFERNFLRQTVHFLKTSQSGAWDWRRKLYKEKGISWQKKHRIPQFYTDKDFALAGRMIDDFYQEYPEFI